jgi:type IV pilus assembly protein PilO
MSRRGPIIVLAISVLVAILLFFFLVLPKMREVSRTEEAVDQARAEELSLRAELARLEGIREDSRRIRRQVARFRRAVPPVADLPGLINALQDAADVSDVDFFSVSPGVPVAFPTVAASEIPAEVQVIGGFFQVDEFLFRLETMDRATKVINISVGPGPDSLPQLQVAMSVEFYTTDPTAGPGTVPEEIEVSPTPGASPTPSPTPTESPTEG